MVRLVPMDSADFDRYLENTVREYAADHVRAGRWSEEESLQKSREEILHLVPEGVATPKQFLFTILAGSPEEKVGSTWLAIEPRGAFVYDLRIDERFRRRGFAEQAMRLLEGVAREQGAEKISLHVFADNRGARTLYVKLGYAETNVMMSKPIER